MRPHDLSFAIDRKQKDGVQHSAAIVIEPHSQESQIIELKGNGRSYVKLSGITGNFYRSEYRKVEPRLIVPGASLSAEDVRAKPNFRSPYVFVPRGQTLERLLKVSPYNPRSLVDFDKAIRGRHNGIYYFYTYPPQEVIAKIKSYAVEGKIGGLVFNVPPFGDKTFNAQQFYDIKELSKYGVKVVWDSSQFGRRLFHRYAFMHPEKMDIFDMAYKSNSIMTIFGSHRPYLVQGVREIDKVVHGFYIYTGGSRGYGTIFSGGGPGSMRQVLHLAFASKMHTGAISLVKEGEFQVTDDKPAELADIAAYSKVIPDFFIPFGIEDINVRQDTLLATSNVYVVAEGGAGTFSEFFEVCVKKGFYFTNEPIFLLGGGGYFNPLIEQLGIMEKRGRISDQVRKHVYPIVDGNQFLPKLVSHYKFQKIRLTGA